MIKWFKRKGNPPSLMSGVLHKMSLAAEKKQRKAANFLNEKVSVLSVRQIRVGFVIFCLAFGAACFWVVWRAFYQPHAIVPIDSVDVPAQMRSPGTKMQPKGILTPEEVKQIHLFSHWLDSLQQSTSGKMMYDSLAANRPGLLDSLATVQQIFNEQLKLK